MWAYFCPVLSIHAPTFTKSGIDTWPLPSVLFWLARSRYLSSPCRPVNFRAPTAIQKRVPQKPWKIFMQTADGRGLDLRGMCDGTRQQAGVNRVANPVGANRSGGGASRAAGSSTRGSRSGGSRGGNCPTANSRAADGSRCGGRAASSRSGGR